MSDQLLGTIITSLVAAIPPCLLAYLAFLQSKRARLEVEKNTVITTETKSIVEEVGLKVDGRFDKLVEDIRSVAHAEGRAEGVEFTESASREAQRVVEQSARDRAEGLAEGRAEKAP